MIALKANHWILVFISYTYLHSVQAANLRTAEKTHAEMPEQRRANIFTYNPNSTFFNLEPKTYDFYICKLRILGYSKLGCW